MDERHERILGEGFEQSFDPNMWSVRVNTIKSRVPEVARIFSDMGYSIEKIPWVEGGFWINTADPITRTSYHQEGLFFSQNASSMIPPVVLDPIAGEVVLDLAASPGSKTTQMSSMMQNRGVIVANDVDPRRIIALRSNLERCGSLNVIVTKSRGEYIWKSGLKFDKVLLDAPCSGTGTMKPGLLESTSQSTIEKLSKKQKILLTSARRSLRDGGIVVYSTCSLEPEENEGVVDFAVRELGMTPDKIDVDVPKEFLGKVFTEWGGSDFEESVSKSMRIIPTNKTEGFFICKLSV